MKMITKQMKMTKMVKMTMNFSISSKKMMVKMKQISRLVDNEPKYSYT